MVLVQERYISKTVNEIRTPGMPKGMLHDLLSICIEMCKFYRKNRRQTYDIQHEICLLILESEENERFQIVSTKEKKLLITLKNYFTDQESDSEKLFMNRNIQHITVYPTREDIERQSYHELRRNVKKGRYTSKSEYLKTQFHLLREDYIIPLREGIKMYRQEVSKHKLSKIDDLYVYKQVKIHAPCFSETGVGYLLSLGEANAARLYRSSDRLKFGTLIALSEDDFQTYYFAIVTNSADKGAGNIVVKFEGCEYREVEHLKTCSLTMLEPRTGYFNAYRHVLKVLQNFSVEDTDIPFQDYIVSCKKEVRPPRYSRSPSPFCVDDDDSFDGDGVTYFNNYSPGTSFSSVETDFSRQRHVTSDEEGSMSSDNEDLDEFQYAAYKAAINQEISVIQGPPGCGKTFLGLKIVKHLEAVAPCSSIIMIVCYTNHALDQFLEGIMQFNSNIVRLGGRSKSKVLENYTLKIKRKNLMRSRGMSEEEALLSRRQLLSKQHTLRKKMNTGAMKIQLLRENIVKTETLAEIMGPFYKFFRWMNNGIYGNEQDTILMEWLFGDNNMLYSRSSFNCKCSFTEIYKEQTLVNVVEIKTFHNENIALCTRCLENKKIKQTVTTCLKTADILNNSDIDENTNIFDQCFPLVRRQRLYRGWVKEYCDKMTALNDYSQLDDVSQRMKEVNKVIDKAILQESKIIGTTTTTAAENWDIFQEIQPTIVIAEEAAEVFEAHLLASLSSGCEHLILIGDHQQLRPKPAVYKLGKKYGLDISLFERLILNNIHYKQLQVQHRMRPEIADNLRFIYKDLKDHEKVKKYDTVKGTLENLFWIDHGHMEEDKSTSESHINIHEAEYLVSLCEFLLLQGYKGSQITVLTFYKGQMNEIKKKLRGQWSEGGSNGLTSERNEVRVDVVDNYQGEENVIVLLSLVRGNERGNTGFVKEEQRICVSLSRAREGLFIVGNSQTVCKHSKIWASIFRSMKYRMLVSNALTLVCQNHPGVKIKAEAKWDFKKFRLGGCERQCETVLKCGHRCSKSCHFVDKEHQDSLCREPCIKICKNRHKCKNRCCERCSIDKCYKSIEKVLQKCNHTVRIRCYQDSEEYVCTQLCGRTLDCGHTCNKKCYESCNPCMQSTCVLSDRCGHINEMPCSLKNQKFKCQQECRKKLPCGHTCQKPCANKCIPCEFKLTYRRECGHLGQRYCWQRENIDKCLYPLNIKRLACGHNEHKLPCFKTKEPCTVKVKYKRNCGHIGERSCGTTETEGLCQAMVSYVRSSCGHIDIKKCCEQIEGRQCTAICGLLLDCGHKCSKICSDSCEEKVPRATNYCNKGHYNNCQAPCRQFSECGHKHMGTCSDCHRGFSHRSCSQMCEYYFACGHKCTNKCNGCEKCEKDCERKCNHRKCGKKCHRLCDPCDKLCSWSCPHLSCTKMCGEICNRQRCDKPCSKLLVCGHRCIGMCGDPCPPACLECNADLFSNINGRLHFVLLPDCGHLVQVDIMDKYMDMKEEQFIWKTCPICSTVIYTLNGNRYERDVNEMWRNVNEIKKTFLYNELLENKLNRQDFAQFNRKRILEYIGHITARSIKLECLKHLTCSSEQNIKTVERAIQRTIDCEYLISVINLLNPKELDELHDAIVAATNIVDSYKQYTDQMHRNFKKFLQQALAEKENLDSLADIRLDCVQLRFDTSDDVSELDKDVGLKDENGIHHIRVIWQIKSPYTKCG